MSKGQGRLWIVAAPSGGGKTSLVESAIKEMDNLVRSVSFTTREQRTEETHGEHYVFVDKTEFERLIVEKQMLEYETVFENYYGTSLEFINKYLDDGVDVVLTIDWQGSRHVKQTVQGSKGIFILPPAINELEKRLRHRASDEALITLRMAEAKEQVSHYDEFDYIIVNDDFDHALKDLMTIFTADRLRRNRQVADNAKLIEALLNE